MRLLALALLTLTAQAAGTDSLPRLVANDIQGLVSDTVNEGEQTAHVIYNGEIPRVNCRVTASKQKANEQWAFCKVEFTVNYEESSAERECGLLYRVEEKAGALTIERHRFFEECVETLSESID